MMTPYSGKTPLKDALAGLCGCSAKSHNKLTQLVNDALHGLGKTSKAKNKGVELNLAIYQWHVDRLHNVKINSQGVNEAVNIVSHPVINDIVNIISQPTGNDSVKTYSHTPGSNNVGGITQPESVENISQAEYVELYSQGVVNDGVETYSQPDSAENISQPVQGEGVEIISQGVVNGSVNLISQTTGNDIVNIVSQAGTGTVETFSQQRIAFYTTGNGVRKRQVIALGGFYVNALMLGLVLISGA